MRLANRLRSSPWFQRAVGVTAAEYLRLVWATTRFTVEPPDAFSRFAQNVPIILAFWHGQHFLMPFARTGAHRVKVLISRHRDGAINAIAAERLGIETIRGSGAHGSDFSRKGGVAGFRALLDALEQGYNVGMTADVPKVARVAGLGIIRLAQMSGRPILPGAIATQRRITFDNWDHTTVNLPFGRGAGVGGALIHVPADADEARLELARRALEESLNAITARAYEIVDRTGKEHDRG
jgi:lysophospholipid acyltransferase (LPLAT)-like uncharacterized protein